MLGGLWWRGWGQGKWWGRWHNWVLSWEGIGCVERKQQEHFGNWVQSRQGIVVVVVVVVVVDDDDGGLMRGWGWFDSWGLLRAWRGSLRKGSLKKG